MIRSVIAFARNAPSPRVALSKRFSEILNRFPWFALNNFVLRSLMNWNWFTWRICFELNYEHHLFLYVLMENALKNIPSDISAFVWKVRKTCKAKVSTTCKVYQLLSAIIARMSKEILSYLMPFHHHEKFLLEYNFKTLTFGLIGATRADSLCHERLILKSLTLDCATKDWFMSTIISMR